MYKILAKTLFLGKQVIYMPTCHSTNDFAIECLEKPDTHEGCIVITDNQTAGRGQRGNLWISSSGLNLTFSVILKPTSLLISDQFVFNMAISLSIVDVLHDILPNENVKIKWPNDIYVNDYKVGGILIENTIEPPFMKTSIVGIGINVNQREFSLERTSSLSLLTGNEYDLKDLLEKLVLSMELRYGQLKSSKFELIRSDYLKYLLGYRQLRRFYSEFEFEATIVGVTDTGKLKVKRGNENLEFDLKEVKFLW